VDRKNFDVALKYKTESVVKCDRDDVSRVLKRLDVLSDYQVIMTKSASQR
jgi:hypothetical protein